MSDIEYRLWELRFDLERSIRYNSRRRAFFDNLHMWTMFLVVLAGSATFASISPLVTGGIVTILGALDLVIGFSHRARDHHQFSKDFSAIVGEIERAETLDDAVLRAWRARRLEIEKNEPPLFKALEASCYNDTLHALGCDPADEVPITRMQNLLMHVHRFEKLAFVRRPGQTLIA